MDDETKTTPSLQPTLRDEDIQSKPIGRRSFLSRAGLVIAGLSLVGAASACPTVSDEPADGAADAPADAADNDPTDAVDADETDADTQDADVTDED